MSLVAQSDISFVGKFSVDPSGATASTFSYGGYGMSFYKDASNRKTIFMAGHDQEFGTVGQIQVPSDANLKPNSASWASLVQATTLQAPHQVCPGFAGFDPGNGNPDWLMGTLVYNGRLALGGSNSYSFNQTVSLGVWAAPTNLAGASSNFHGFYTNTATGQPRSIGGYLFAIPPTWQGAFGGPVFCGNSCLSVISTTSFGPALTVINPDTIGVNNPVPGFTVLEYPGPGPNTICRTNNCEAGQNVYFNLVTRVLGGMFVPGTDTVMFVCGHGVGPYFYGTAADAGDPVMTDVKGPHAQPYRYQILAYNAADLAAVKAGTANRWDPLPYNKLTPWVLNECSGDYPQGGQGDDPRGHGTCMDTETGRLYIRTLDGNQPTVYVYQVTLGAGGGGGGGGGGGITAGWLRL